MMNAIKDLRGIALFMLITIVFHIIWKLFSGWFENTAVYIAMSDFTTSLVYYSSVWVNELLIGGRMTRIDASFTMALESLTANGSVTRQLIVDHTCSGLKQFYQAFFLFLIYPGIARHKLWYIPMALVVMHVVNIFRIVALSFTMLYAYQHWDFVHDWVVRPLFYVVLFGLWVVWDKYFYLAPGSKN